MALSTATATPAPQPAGLRLRLAALLYDGLLLLALWFLASALLIPLLTSAEAARQHEITVIAAPLRQLLLFPLLVLLTWLFYGYFWTRAGQTLGMQTWRLQLRRADGTRPRWRDAWARCAAACLLPVLSALLAQALWPQPAAVLLSMMLGFLANYLWRYGNPERLCWHDQLSATRVWRLPPGPASQRRFLAWFSEQD